MTSKRTSVSAKHFQQEYTDSGGFPLVEDNNQYAVGEQSNYQNIYPYVFSSVGVEFVFCFCQFEIIVELAEKFATW